jgi:hypothetical protein
LHDNTIEDAQLNNALPVVDPGMVSFAKMVQGSSAGNVSKRVIRPGISLSDDGIDDDLAWTLDIEESLMRNSRSASKASSNNVAGSSNSIPASSSSKKKNMLLISNGGSRRRN